VTELTFPVDVSRTYRNKEGYDHGYELNTSFKTETHTAATFLENVVREGWPYTMVHLKRTPEETGAAARGVVTPKHVENFICSQLLTGDDDSEAAGVVDWWLSDPFFSKHGLAFVESVSSQPGAEKGHPTLLFDRPVEDPSLYKECMKALRFTYPQLDNLSNIDRTIYNQQNARVHVVGHVCPFEVFEREILEPYRQAQREKAAAIEAERKRRQAEYERRKANGETVADSTAERYLSGYLDWVFDHVAKSAAGDNRNSRIHWAGREVAGVEATEWAGPYLHLLDDVDTRIVAAARSNGYLKEYAHDDEAEVLRIFNRGRAKGGDALEAPTVTVKTKRETPPEPAAPPDFEALSEESPTDPLMWTDTEHVPDTADYVSALEGLGYRFRMNTTNDVVEVNNEPMSDALRSKIRCQLRDLNYRHVNVAEDAWIAHAYDNSYHPVQEFLDGLTWDGEDHIGLLADHFADRDGFFGVFFRRWAIGAVARAYEPRSCQNRMFILDGEQGIGKSYLVRWLASPLERPELFIEGPINPEDKDDYIRLITAWIWEVSELGSTTRRADREALKYFLSQQQVTVRKPYGHYDLIKPALASFIGTVNNNAGFLDDPTGYRRFMGVRLTRIDWAYDDILDPAQVWAQAKALYDAGKPWELNDTEADMARHAIESFEVEDPLLDLLQRHYEITGEPGDFVATVDVRDTLNVNGWRLNSPKGEVMAISSTMKQLGLEGSRRTVNGKQERGYAGVKRC